MALFDVETVLLGTVVPDVITNKCLYVFSKSITSDDKWLQSCYVCYEQCSWAQWQLQVVWVACGHAVYRPPSVSVIALVDPVEIAHDAVE